MLEEKPAGSQDEAGTAGQGTVCKTASHSTWGFVEPTESGMQTLAQSLTCAESSSSDQKTITAYRNMMPPRLFNDGQTGLFKDEVGGNVRPDKISDALLVHLNKKNAITAYKQDPPSVMRLHPGSMHLVRNHKTQIKFASEVMLPQQVAIAAAYHVNLGSVYFGEAMAEDYTSMYLQLEKVLSGR